MNYQEVQKMIDSLKKSIIEGGNDKFVSDMIDAIVALTKLLPYL